MIRKHYPELFADEPEWRARAEALAAKSHELVSFLTDVLGVTAVAARHDGQRHLSRFLLGPARARHPAHSRAGC